MASSRAGTAQVLLRVSRALWLLSAVGVLVGTLAGFDGRPNSDIEEVLAWTMVTLGFPLSLVYPVIFAVFADIRAAMGSSPLATSYMTLVLSWCALFALGYAQWFRVVPALVRLLTSRHGRRVEKEAGHGDRPASHREGGGDT